MSGEKPESIPPHILKELKKNREKRIDLKELFVELLREYLAQIDNLASMNTNPQTYNPEAIKKQKIECAGLLYSINVVDNSIENPEDAKNKLLELTEEEDY